MLEQDEAATANTLKGSTDQHLCETVGDSRDDDAYQEEEKAADIGVHAAKCFRYCSHRQQKDGRAQKETGTYPEGLDGRAVEMFGHDLDAKSAV